MERSLCVVAPVDRIWGSSPGWLPTILHRPRQPRNGVAAGADLPKARAHPISGVDTATGNPFMSQPVVVQIPHRLGRAEAARRIKGGFANARSNYASLVTFHEESWSGDRLVFNVSALGQTAAGQLDIADDHVRVEVRLPWLLAKIAEQITPAIRKQTTLLLEKK